jgi:hypothetical protein
MHPSIIASTELPHKTAFRMLWKHSFALKEKFLSEQKVDEPFSVTLTLKTDRSLNPLLAQVSMPEILNVFPQ